MAKKLKRFIIDYTVGGERREIEVWTATRGAAIESITTGDLALCARSEILSVYCVA